ncbi:MAG: hypothetical protein IID32_09555 [Planctomycetes bacterium]|nr:hypothetical protein [Planctomycetota bacterium]
MRANYGKPLRQWLKEYRLEEIIDFGDLPVFQKSTTYPCIIRIGRDGPVSSFQAANIKSLNFQDLSAVVDKIRFDCQPEMLGLESLSLTSSNVSALLEKLKSRGIPLGEYVQGRIYRGILTGLNKAFVIDEATKDRLISEDSNSKDLIKPFLAGRDIKRYGQLHTNKYLLFTRRGININQYPSVLNYLSVFRRELTPKPAGYKGEKWGGRKPGSGTKADPARARELREKGLSHDEIAATLKVSVRTVFRALARSA